MSNKFKIGDIVNWSNSQHGEEGCRIVETRPLNSVEVAFIKSHAPDDLKELDLNGPSYRCVDTDGVSFESFTTMLELA